MILASRCACRSYVMYLFSMRIRGYVMPLQITFRVANYSCVYFYSSVTQILPFRKRTQVHASPSFKQVHAVGICFGETFRVEVGYGVVQRYLPSLFVFYCSHDAFLLLFELSHSLYVVRLPIKFMNMLSFSSSIG